MFCEFLVLIVFVNTSFGALKGVDQDIIETVFPQKNAIHATPVKDPASTLTVSLGFEIKQLIDVSTHGQQLRLRGFLRMEWKNELVSWDPSKYGNITQIRIDSDLAWIPEVIIYSSIQQTGEEEEGENDKDTWSSVHDIKTKLLVKNNGATIWNSPLSFRSTCKFHVSRFPYDKQKCEIKFGPWSNSKIKFIADTRPVMTSNFVENQEWEVLDTDIHTERVDYPTLNAQFWEVHLHLSIKRKVLFYEFHLLIPPLFLVLLLLVAHRLPVECGERITLEMVTKLSFIFMLLFSVTKILPRTSELSLMTILYTCFTLLVWFSTLSSVLVLNIYHKSTSLLWVPRFLEKRCLPAELWQSSLHQSNKFAYTEEREVLRSNNANDGDFSPETNVQVIRRRKEKEIHVKKKLLEVLRSINDKTYKDAFEKRFLQRNQLIALVIDRLVFYMLVLFCVVVVLLIIVLHSLH